MKMLLILLLFLPVGAHAETEWGQFEFEFDQDKPWSEVSATLPGFPENENLIPFNVSAATRNQHYIDANSISVGSDGVIRYSVVVEAAGGARNISFEGMRCESGEGRLYAYGHPDGTWSKARKAGWERIKFRSLLSYRKALYEDFFCRDEIRVKDGKEAVKRLRRAAR